MQMPKPTIELTLKSGLVKVANQGLNLFVA